MDGGDEDEGEFTAGSNISSLEDSVGGNSIDQDRTERRGTDTGRGEFMFVSVVFEGLVEHHLEKSNMELNTGE